MKSVHKHFDTIYSTNTWALQNAQILDKEALTVIAADGQSAGRGRLNRSWKSPHGVNLYASFCLFLKGDLKSLSNIPQVLALSCAELLKGLLLAPTLKWPNDLLIDGKKIAGTLCETKPIDDQRLVVAGIGLNVNMTEEQVNNLEKPATSILIETGLQHDPKSLLSLLEERFERNMEVYKKEGFGTFHEAFQQQVSLEETIQFSTEQETLEGKISKINPDGSMTLIMPDGRKKIFYYGEISFQ